MGPARFQENPDQAHAVSALQHMIFQLTVFAMGLIADTGGVCFRILAQIVFQYTRIIRGCSVNHGQIFFFQSVCAHRVGQPGSRLGGFGINHHPAHRPV